MVLSEQDMPILIQPSKLLFGLNIRWSDTVKIEGLIRGDNNLERLVKIDELLL